MNFLQYEWKLSKKIYLFVKNLHSMIPKMLKEGKNPTICVIVELACYLEVFLVKF